MTNTPHEDPKSVEAILSEFKNKCNKLEKDGGFVADHELKMFLIVPWLKETLEAERQRGEDLVRKERERAVQIVQREINSAKSNGEVLSWLERIMQRLQALTDNQP